MPVYGNSVISSDAVVCDRALIGSIVTAGTWARIEEDERFESVLQ